jgi:DNA-binding transcriptional ArsR family regulator
VNKDLQRGRAGALSRPVPDDFDDADGLAGDGGDEVERFVDEYFWLRSFGKTDAAIARHLKTTDAGLVKRLQRAGVRRVELSADQEIDSRLRDLIAAGRPFDIRAFQFWFDPVLVAAAISTAVRRGLVVRLGTRPGMGCRVGIFQEAAAAARAVGPVVRVVA